LRDAFPQATATDTSIASMNQFLVPNWFIDDIKTVALFLIWLEEKFYTY